MLEQPLIIDIKGNAVDDGPGIRSVVFFKGCPMDCIWCQNPESKKVAAELSWDRERCVACRTCIDACPEGAISPDNPFYINRARCTRCFQCLEVCPSQALTRVGHKMKVADIIREIIPYKPFFDTSGGGVTLSGGEPTFNMEFSSALLKELKKNEIHTVLETCGWFNLEKFKALILPYVDLIFMDVKLINPEEHRRYCGVSNKLILSNLLYLHEQSLSGRFILVPRTPLIPEMTDREDQIINLSLFYREHHISSAVMLPNNPIWLDKCAKLGKETPFDRSKPIGAFYDQEKKKKIIEQFSRYGITVTFG